MIYSFAGFLFFYHYTMQSQFLAAINQLCDEKNISQESVVETIKAALKTAYRKDYGTREQNIDIDIDPKSGLATVFLVRDVVSKVDDPEIEISLKEAKGYDKEIKIGDVLRVDVTPPDYGRIAAQAAKQVIIQRVQEAERDVMYDTFKDRENELINAIVHRVDSNNNVYITLDNKITTVLAYDQQIPGEKYYGGQRIKLYLNKVMKTTKGPKLDISRRHPQLIAKLLELEIPEVKSGLVKIMGIARDAGVRCKVAVASDDEKIDPIGSCVGQKGVRVQSVMDELNGERIDIIQYNEDSEKFIKTALAPAKVATIILSDSEKRAQIYVEADQRPLAIGKNGQNVRLASILTGWELDVLDVSELKDEEAKKKAEVVAKKEAVKSMSVDELDLSSELIEALTEANLTLVEQLKGLSAKDFASIEGIDEDGATKIVKTLKALK